MFFKWQQVLENFSTGLVATSYPAFFSEDYTTVVWKQYKDQLETLKRAHEMKNICSQL